MAQDTHNFLQTFAVVLCTAAVTTIVFQRLRQPVVLGYLLAGMVVGPYIPIPVEADDQIVHTMAELGIVLLMFSLGIEFSFEKLMKVGPAAVFVAVVQCSLMIWLGYLAGQAFGWSKLVCLYAGAAIAISSTTIIVKAFEEQRIREDFVQVVFGVLIVQDLIAILLITILTALSLGKSLDLVDLGVTAGRLALFLAALIIVGLFTVPRMFRVVVRMERPETTVVAGVGLAFGCAYLAAAFGYSVALGAFIAGSLVAESGVEQAVGHLVQPVRDIFVAVFFVSVGMLIDPAQILGHWQAVLVFFALVVVGNIAAVTFASFLTGQSVQTSLKAGMSLAQIGEFSFIIAGVGVATGATDKLLYSLAVAVSGLTTLTTPWLIRLAGPTAAYVDEKLPRSLQTFAALYGSWLEDLRSDRGRPSLLRQRIRWLATDAIVAAMIVIGASLELDIATRWVQEWLEVSQSAAMLLVVGAASIASMPFWIGMIRVARALGFELANRAFPSAESGKVDLSAAPRRLFVVTLQLAVVMIVGLPLVAVTQPFLPPLRGALLLALITTLLAIAFWRSATDFQGHTRAAAEALAEALATTARQGRAHGHSVQTASAMLIGLGSPVPIELVPGSPAAGRTLAELQIRGLTGATVLAIRRGDASVAVPSGTERLLVGDVLAVAGTSEAVEAARKLLTGGTVSA